MSLGADDKEGRLLPKALPHLHLHAGGARLPQLAALAERAAASLTDKAAVRHVHKLQERLAKLDDDRRKVKTPGSKRAKAVESAEDARIRQVFEQFDTDRSGRLDHRELRPCLEQLGVPGNSQNVLDAIVKYGEGNRTLDLLEFAELVSDIIARQEAAADLAQPR